MQCWHIGCVSAFLKIFNRIFRKLTKGVRFSHAAPNILNIKIMENSKKQKLYDEAFTLLDRVDRILLDIRTRCKARRKQRKS